MNTLKIKKGHRANYQDVGFEDLECLPGETWEFTVRVFGERSAGKRGKVDGVFTVGAEDGELHQVAWNIMEDVLWEKFRNRISVDAELISEPSIERETAEDE